MIDFAKTRTRTSNATPANEPRWKKGHGTRTGFWYLFTDNKKVSLTKYGAPITHTGKNGSRIERDRARDARDAYLASVAVAAPRQVVKRALTVGDICDLYLVEHASTCTGYANINKTMREFLDGRDQREYGCLPFVGLRNLPFDQLDSKHIKTWEKAHPNWSQTGRANCISTIKAAINYAITKELIETNPLKQVKLERNKARRLSIKESEEKALRKYMAPALEAWFDAALDCGTRPMELGKATTDHLKESKTGRLNIVLEHDEWKCGKKLEVERLIPLPERLQGYVKARLAEAKKQGSPVMLWPKPRGGKWTLESLSIAFNRVLKRAIAAGEKINPKLSAYCTRHTMITRSLLAGVPIAIVAKVCGTSVAMIERHYSDVAAHHDVLESVVDRVR